MAIKILENLKTVDDKEVIARCREVDKSPMVRGVILDCRQLYFNRYSDLRVISRTGVGTDNIDFEKCKERDIKVYTAPCNELTAAVAEHTMMLIYNILRKSAKGRNLGGMKVCVIGCGRIGTEVYERLELSGCEVHGIDKEYHGGKKSDPVEQWGLEDSDIVTIHVSGNEQVIGGGELKLMKKGSYLINTARAGCVDACAVAKALGRGKLAGFASDVNSPTHFCKNSIAGKVVLTSHNAGNTVEARTAVERLAVENLIKGLKGAKE